MFLIRFYLQIASIVIVLISFEASLYAAKPFAQAEEFPNYFANSKVSAQEMRQLLEKAVASHLKRLTLPIVLPGKSEISLVRYFELIRAESKKIDPTVQILASGGLLRADLSAIYDEIKRELESHPLDQWGKKLTVSEVLLKIAQARMGEDISGLTIRGVGGDFDLLVQAGDSTKAAEIRQRILSITNSAEAMVVGGASFQSGLKRTLFSIGDVKDYDRQLQRSTRQGGSTLDFLAFDLDAEKFVEPAGFDNIVSDFIQGYYSYIAPVDQKFVEDAAKQTIRGIRPFLELPFLKLKDETVLREELQQLEESLKAGKKLSAKAIEQFHKLIRNHRYEGAHNRFYRGLSNSIEELVLRIANLAQPKETLKAETYLPEFGNYYSITQRTQHHFYKELPDDIKLIAGSDFIKLYTKEGAIFHGTPNIENAIAILRGGFFKSSKTQGVAAYGPGVYASPDEKVAQGYASSAGVVFNLQLNHVDHLRILNWPEVENLPSMKKIVADAKAQNMHPFEFLAQEFGIDIVINNPLLIQNVAAISAHHSLADLISSYVSKINSSEQSLLTKITNLETYKKLYFFGMALGINNLPVPKSDGQLIFEELLWLAKSQGEISTDKLEQLVGAISQRLNNGFYEFELPSVFGANAEDLELIQKFLNKRIEQDLDVKNNLVNRLSQNRQNLTLYRYAQLIKLQDISVPVSSLDIINNQFKSLLNGSENEGQAYQELYQYFIYMSDQNKEQYRTNSSIRNNINELLAANDLAKVRKALNLALALKITNANLYRSARPAFEKYIESRQDQEDLGLALILDYYQRPLPELIQKNIIQQLSSNQNGDFPISHTIRLQKDAIIVVQGDSNEIFLALLSIAETNANSLIWKTVLKYISQIHNLRIDKSKVVQYLEKALRTASGEVKAAIYPIICSKLTLTNDRLFYKTFNTVYSLAKNLSTHSAEVDQKISEILQGLEIVIEKYRYLNEDELKSILKMLMIDYQRFGPKAKHSFKKIARSLIKYTYVINDDPELQSKLSLHLATILQQPLNLKTDFDGIYLLKLLKEIFSSAEVAEVLKAIDNILAQTINDVELAEDAEDSPYRSTIEEMFIKIRERFNLESIISSNTINKMNSLRWSHKRISLSLIDFFNNCEILLTARKK